MAHAAVIHQHVLVAEPESGYRHCACPGSTIVFDRTRAQRIAHVSGSWAAPGIENRPNAFAAYLLMPRALVVRHPERGGRIDGEETRRLAALLRVNESALVEHLFNISLIDYVEHEQLRTAFGAWR